MSVENIYKDKANQTSKICWSAIISGALIAFGLTLIFNLLFVSVGLNLNISTVANEEYLPLIISLFYVIGGFLLLYIAGIITGRIYKGSIKRNETKPNQGKNASACFSAMHGFIAWVVYLLINLTFLSLLSQATPIESPFMYVNSDNAPAQEHKEKSNSMQKMANSQNDQTGSIELTDNEAIEAAQNGAMLIFIIFTSGVIAFVIGSWKGCNPPRSPNIKQLEF